VDEARRSLRRRLLFLLLSLIALVWAGASYRIWDESQHEVEEVFDANLAETARLLLTLTRHELETVTRNPRETAELRDLDEVDLIGHKYEHKIAFRVFDAQGHTLFHSPNAPSDLRTSRLGEYEEQFLDGKRWRLFSLGQRFGSVHVGMRIEIRDEVVNYVLQSILWPMPFGLLLVAALVWWAVGRGLQPLNRIAGELVGRSAEDLRRLRQDHTPIEVQPLVDALNGLLGRLEQAFENERRFTADASHELRTPLAAIRVQAQVALKATEPEQRTRALRQIVSGIDRATHLVEQLLALARADSQRAEKIRSQQADLARIAREVLGQLSGLAIKRSIELYLEGTGGGDWRITGDPNDLSLLLRNLVENALRYTQEGGKVRVRLRRDGEERMLSVTDNGPGIPAAQLNRIFERFHRAAPQSISGSGLGLSIVERIAELHDARIFLGDAPGGRGLRVEVRFRHRLKGQTVAER